MDALTVFQLVGGVVLLGVVTAFLLIARRRELRERRQPWTGQVLRFEFTQGLQTTNPGGGGTTRYNTDTMYVRVYYRRDDGVESFFEAPDRDPLLSSDPPNLYREIMEHWREGDRIEKPEGDGPPRRVVS